LANECVEYLDKPSTRKLIDSIPPPEPDPRLAWMWPPQDVHDRIGWDHFWNNQAAHHFFVQKAAEGMAAVSETTALMRSKDFKTILCAGGGVSTEPVAMAAAGFDVVVVELSGVAIDLCRTEFPAQPRLRYVEGSSLHPQIEPGPFDMVNERRTLQLFSG
jgi:hypothetical protein